MRFMPYPTKSQQYLKGFWPTPKSGRLSYDDTVKVLLNTSWRKENNKIMAHAIAITRRESAGDPLAYLAYLIAPGREDGTPWQQKVYANNAKWLRSIPVASETEWNVVPTYWELPAVLRTRGKYDELIHRRIRFEKTKRKPWPPRLLKRRPRADTGLFQLNAQYFPIEWDADANAEEAYKIWKGWGKSFNAWATNDPDSLAPFITQALAAVKRVRG